MYGRDTMPDSAALAEILRRGYTGAIVNFSGGNDEGGPDSMYFTLAEIDPETEQPRLVKIEGSWWNTQDELIKWLGGLPSTEYGSFAGEFSVHGTITVNPSRIDKPISWSVEEMSEYSHKEW